MKEDLGINMHDAIVSLKLDGMLDYRKQKGANNYKVWRLRCMNIGEEE